MRWSRRSSPGDYDFIVANYANADMVGHTGSWDATTDALATIDACLARVVDAALAVDPDGPARSSRSRPITATRTACATWTASPVTAHSLNPVPLVLIGRATDGPAPRTTASWQTSHPPCWPSRTCRRGPG